MNRHVRAYAPRLFNLANQSKHASLCVDNSTTYFTKKANIVNLDSINCLLVEEAIKLGSAVLQSIGASKQEELLRKKKDSDKQEVKESMDLKKGLMAGAALSAVPVLAANYTLNKASDDFDAKMMAIPGLAAATVGAILAARNMGNNTQGYTKEVPNEITSELESALLAKEVVDNAISKSPDADVADDLQKMSSIGIDHIAALITEILV